MKRVIVHYIMGCPGCGMKGYIKCSRCQTGKEACTTCYGHQILCSCGKPATMNVHLGEGANIFGVMFTCDEHAKEEMNAKS